MSELCVLAAVSLATSQSDHLHRLVEHPEADHLSLGHVARREEPTHCPPIESEPQAEPLLSSVEFSPGSSSEASSNSDSGDSDSDYLALPPAGAPAVSLQASQGDRPSPKISSPETLPETPPAVHPETHPEMHPDIALAQIYVPARKALRPSSGSQFYRQRRVALQTGQSYTRIAADSFANHWLDSTYRPSHQDWVNLLAREAQAMAAGQGSNRLTVMVGDSISLWFPTEYMPRHRFWLNQSISGDTATGVLERLSLFEGTNPDIIHVMVGINDLRAGVSSQQLLSTQQQIIRRLRRSHPQSRIIVHSVLPTRLAHVPNPRIRRINQQLGAIATHEGAELLDLHRYFTDDDGNLRQDLTTDGLHLNAAGYERWYRVLRQMNLT